MTRQSKPVFLERGTYRRRRMRDAAQLLPILGLLLFLVPLLWTGDPDAPATTGRGIIYVFAAWAGLIASSMLLSLWLTAPGASEDEPDSDNPPQ